MSKLRFGVLGTARIATELVIPAIARSQRCEVGAIASRSGDHARRAAQQLGIPVAHGSYEALLADPGIDAVYIALPNHLHVAWSVRALESGKHVLCEKPIALDASEARTLLDEAAKHPDLACVEAFMYRHHPQWQAVRASIAAGEIGELRTVQSFFSYSNEDPADIRNSAACGGGALMDIGCYCVSYPRFLFGAEPVRVIGHLEPDPRWQVDRLSSGMLEFADGTATFTCSTQLEPYQRTVVLGTRGRIEIEIPCNAPNDRPCRVWLERRGTTRELALKTANQYTLQADAFAAAVLDGQAPMPLADAVANMAVLDALRRSQRSGAWEQP